MFLARNPLRALSLFTPFFLAAASACVGGDPEPTPGGAGASSSGSGGQASSGAASSSSGSGASEPDAGKVPDAAAPVIAFCAEQPAATRKFCEDFENAGAALGDWSYVPPANSGFSLTSEPNRGKVLYFDLTASDAGPVGAVLGKVLEPVSLPYVVEYDMRVNEHPPSQALYPFNGFISGRFNNGFELRYGVAQGMPQLGGGSTSGKDGGFGPDGLNPYTSSTPNNLAEVKDIGFNAWFHVRIQASATGDAEVTFQNTEGVVTRRGGQLAQLTSFSLGFESGLTQRWTVFFDNVLVRTGN